MFSTPFFRHFLMVLLFSAMGFFASLAFAAWIGLHFVYFEQEDGGISNLLLYSYQWLGLMYGRLISSVVIFAFIYARATFGKPVEKLTRCWFVLLFTVLGMLLAAYMPQVVSFIRNDLTNWAFRPMLLRPTSLGAGLLFSLAAQTLTVLFVRRHSMLEPEQKP